MLIRFPTYVCSTRDLVGFGFGLASIAFWVVAQVPQLVANYRRKSADALSAVFLAEWLLGDTSNLLGALLKGDQPQTVVLTAQYFICMDCVLLVQWLYYTSQARRRERVIAGRRRHHHHHHHHHHPHRLRRDHEVNGRTSSEGLRHQSLRMRAGHTSTTEALGEAHENLARVSGEIQVVRSEEGEDRSSTPTAAAGVGQRRKMAAVAALTTTTVTGLLTGIGPGSLGGVARVAEYNGHAARRLLLSLSREGGGWQQGSALASATALDASSAGAMNLGMHAAWKQSAGAGLGYLSCVLYLNSRMAQIYRTWRRRSAEGLALSMFLCAISANLCYGLGLLLRARSADEFFSSLPWVLGSLGTVAMDVIILVQAWYWYPSTGHSKHGTRSDEAEPLLLPVVGSEQSVENA
jgi:solute carrier family 66 (lysosomal lysine-arginine transporter), member 1